MMKTTGLMLAGALLAAPLAMEAQTPEAPAHRGHAGMMRGGGPGGGLAAMLQKRAELGLTAEQVARLEAIERDLRTRNEPLRQQIAAAMPERAERAERPRLTEEQRRAMREQRRERSEARPRMTEEQRQQMRARMEQVRPVMEQMRANTRTAMEQARAVLTEEQRGRLQQEMRERRGPRHGGERGMRSRTGERAPRTR